MCWTGVAPSLAALWLCSAFVLWGQQAKTGSIFAHSSPGAWAIQRTQDKNTARNLSNKTGGHRLVGQALGTGVVRRSQSSAQVLAPWENPGSTTWFCCLTFLGLSEMMVR